MTGLTIEEAMALAVLRGDRTAARALADSLMGADGLPEPAAGDRTAAGPPHSRDVWAWPEFRALASRLGVALIPRTVELVIRLHADEVVEVNQRYYLSDAQAGTVGEAEGT